MDGMIKMLVVSAVTAAVLVYLNNRYRLPIIGLSQAEMERMARDRALAEQARTQAAGAA